MQTIFIVLRISIRPIVSLNKN